MVVWRVHRRSCGTHQRQACGRQPRRLDGCERWSALRALVTLFDVSTSLSSNVFHPLLLRRPHPLSLFVLVATWNQPPFAPLLCTLGPWNARLPQRRRSSCASCTTCKIPCIANLNDWLVKRGEQRRVRVNVVTSKVRRYREPEVGNCLLP